MPSGMSMSGMPSSAAAPTQAPVAADSVTIHNFAFGPQVVSVKVGTTVHWTNRDGNGHAFAFARGHSADLNTLIPAGSGVTPDSAVRACDRAQTRRWRRYRPGGWPWNRVNAREKEYSEP